MWSCSCIGLSITFVGKDRSPLLNSLQNYPSKQRIVQPLRSWESFAFSIQESGLRSWIDWFHNLDLGVLSWIFPPRSKLHYLPSLSEKLVRNGWLQTGNRRRRKPEGRANGEGIWKMTRDSSIKIVLAHIGNLFLRQFWNTCAEALESCSCCWSANRLQRYRQWSI